MTSESNFFIVPRPYISIIVPVYNAEKYISRIIDQILCQDFTNYEVIIVNDGSSDATGLIIDNYAQNHIAQIITVHQKNSGVSVARNTGINLAKGKYLCFIDADDEIKPSFLFNLITAAIENSSDLIIGGYIKVNGQNKMLPNITFDRTLYQNVINAKDIGVPFSKLYSADIVNNHKIRFPEGMKLSEDAVFLYRYLLHSQRCTFIDAQDYIYYAPTSTRKYDIEIKDEINGLKAMADATISLMAAIPLDCNGTERLRKRVICSVHRTIFAIISRPRRERVFWYLQVDWHQLVPYISADAITKYLLYKHKFLFLKFSEL